MKLKKNKHANKKMLLAKICVFIGPIFPLLGIATTTSSSPMTTLSGSLADDEKAIADLDETDLDTRPEKAEGAIVLYDTKPSRDDVTKPSLSGYTFTFNSATKVDKDGVSKITFNVQKGAARGTIIFLVSSFETQAQHNQRNLNNILTKNSKPSRKVDRQQVYLGARPNGDNFNFPAWTGTKIAFKQATPINDAGETTVTYSITFGDGAFAATKDESATVSGFETIAEAIERKVQNLLPTSFDLLLEAEKKMLASNFQKTQLVKKLKEVVGANEKQRALITEADVINIISDDNSGTLTFKIINHGEEKVLQLLKFLTTRQKVKKDEDMAVIEKVNWEDININKLAKNQKASAITKPASGTTKSGVDYEFTFWNPKDKGGELEWQARLSKGDFGASKMIKGTISDFLTIEQAKVKANDQIIINTVTTQKVLTNNFDKNQKASMISKPPSGITESGVQFTFTKWQAKDAIGTILWTAKLTKGAFGATRNLDSSITGFLTTSEEKANQNLQAIVEMNVQSLSVLQINISRDNLPSEVTNKILLDTIKNLVGVNKKQKDLVVSQSITNVVRNDELGVLSFVIKGFGNDKVIMINDFTTSQKRVALKAAKQIVANKIQALKRSDIKINQYQLSSSVTKSQILTAIRLTFGDDELQKSLLKAADIQNMTTISGLEFTIHNHGEPKKIAFISSYFVIVDDFNKVEEAIKNLEDDSLDSLANSNMFASQITKTQIVKKVREIIANNLDNRQKQLVVANNITKTANDDKGIITISIVGHGDNKLFSVVGFKTDYEALRLAIQRLKNRDLESLDKKNVTSKITSNQVLKILKEVSYIRFLTKAQINKLQEKNILLKSNSKDGKLVVTIIGFGKDKILEVSDFQKGVKETSGGLSAGAIFGISFGTLVGIGGIGALAYFLYKLVKAGKIKRFW